MSLTHIWACNKYLCHFRAIQQSKIIHQVAINASNWCGMLWKHLWVHLAPKIFMKLLLCFYRGCSSPLKLINFLKLWDSRKKFKAWENISCLDNHQQFSSIHRTLLCEIRWNLPYLATQSTSFFYLNIYFTTFFSSSMYLSEMFTLVRCCLSCKWILNWIIAEHTSKCAYDGLTCRNSHPHFDGHNYHH